MACRHEELEVQKPRTCFLGTPLGGSLDLLTTYYWAITLLTVGVAVERPVKETIRGVWGWTLKSDPGDGGLPCKVI